MGKHQKNAKTTTNEQQKSTGVAHVHEKQNAHSTESKLVNEIEILIKQEPLNQDSPDTGSDVHNSQIDVVKVCGNSSESERAIDVFHSKVTEVQVTIEPVECMSTEIKETPRSRLTADQRWIMVEFLRRNKAIIMGRCAGPVATRQRAKVLAQMAKTLNSTVDGAVKTPDKWLSLEPLTDSASLPVVMSYKYSQPASDTNIEPSTDEEIPLNELKVKQNKVKKLSCDLCNYQCSNKNTLGRHMKTHIGEKLYTCKHCEFKGGHIGDLKLHLKTHSEKTPYSCKDCEYTCAQIGTYKRHLRIHTGEKPHTCKVCKCKFSTTGNLKRHIKTHADEKPYTCDHCELKFSRSGHLQTHMRIHTGEKPYNCEYCDYKGTQISALKRHLRTHTGEKPYSCKYCGFRSAQNGGLIRHLRTHTGEKPYPCEQCDYKCSTTSDLKRHNMRNHKDTLHL